MNNSVNNLATAFSQNSQLIDSLKAAIQTQIEMGDPSISRFNQAIDLVIKQNYKGHSLSKGDVILFSSVGAGMNINAITYQI